MLDPKRLQMKTNANIVHAMYLRTASTRLAASRVPAFPAITAMGFTAKVSLYFTARLISLTHTKHTYKHYNPIRIH